MKISHTTRRRRVLSAFMVVVCAISLLATAVAATPKSSMQPRRTVRLGVSDLPHFMQTEPDGSYRGIVFDYIDEITKYTGWNIEVVPATASECLNLLSSGEIDLMGAMIKNEQTTSLYDFAELSSGYSYSTVTIKKGLEKSAPNNYSRLSGMRIGIFSKAISRIEAFEQFCTVNGIKVISVYFDDAKEWEEAFASGAVDAQLTSSVKLREGEEILISFRQEHYYFAVTKGKSDIMRELNLALEQINMMQPQFEIDLYEQYFGKGGLSEFTLTESERQFIQAHPVLRVTASPDWAPISYFDQKTGTYRGITADVLALLAQVTGLTFEFLPAKTFQESLEMLQSGAVDLHAGIYDPSYLSDDLRFTLSLPYLSSQITILQRNGIEVKNLERPIWAMPYGFESKEAPENFEARHYKTVDDCIAAVKGGAADFAIVGNLTAERYTQGREGEGLAIVPIADISLPLQLALQDPTNPLLISILDKAIHSISEEETQAIILRNTAVESAPVTLTSLIYAHPLQSLSVIVGVSLLVLLLLYFAMSSKLKLSRVLTRNAEAAANIDPLTGLYNKKRSEQMAREHFEQGDILPSAAMLIMDLDHFKQTNDTLGHLGGDEVLMLFAKTIRSVFCSGEILGRWGGDEFFVFLEDAGEKKRLEAAAVQLCEAMDQDFVYGGNACRVSISVGIAFARGKESFEEMFKAADAALYEKKRGSKNGYQFERDAG